MMSRLTLSILIPTALIIGIFAGQMGPAFISSLKKENASLLFVHTGTSGTIQSSTNGTYTISIIGVPDAVVWFSDRPEREAGTMSIDGFLNAWNHFGFTDVPPNATLELFFEKDHIDTVIAELDNPIWDADTKTMTYTATLLKEVENDRYQPFKEISEKQLPETFDFVSVFIDNADAKIINGCLIAPGTSCPGKDFTEKDLSFSDLSNANLEEANFTKANLWSTKLNNANLYKANFTDAKLALVDFSGARVDMDLYNKYLSSSMLKDQVDIFVELDWDSKDVSNKYVKGTFQNKDFSGVNFSGSDLSRFYCLECTLTNADFSNANLETTNFYHSDLTGANFTGANLNMTNFMEATLTDTTFGNNTNINIVCPDGSFRNNTQC